MTVRLAVYREYFTLAEWLTFILKFKDIFFSCPAREQSSPVVLGFIARRRKTIRIPTTDLNSPWNLHEIAFLSSALFYHFFFFFEQLKTKFPLDIFQFLVLKFFFYLYPRQLLFFFFQQIIKIPVENLYYR